MTQIATTLPTTPDTEPNPTAPVNSSVATNSVTPSPTISPTSSIQNQPGADPETLLRTDHVSRQSFHNDRGWAFKANLRELAAVCQNMNQEQLLRVAETLMKERAFDRPDHEAVLKLWQRAQSGDAAALEELRKIIKDTAIERQTVAPEYSRALASGKDVSNWPGMPGAARSVTSTAPTGGAPNLSPGSSSFTPTTSRPERRNPLEDESSPLSVDSKNQIQSYGDTAIAFAAGVRAEKENENRIDQVEQEKQKERNQKLAEELSARYQVELPDVDMLADVPGADSPELIEGVVQRRVQERESASNERHLVFHKREQVDVNNNGKPDPLEVPAVVDPAKPPQQPQQLNPEQKPGKEPERRPEQDKTRIV